MCTALYDFNGENPDDLSFAAGTTIYVLDKTDPSGWWRGQTAEGAQGFFPMNFVDIGQQ